MTLVLDGTNNTYLDATTRGQLMTLSTAVATTSGTSIDFTGIPSWAKKITVMFNEVSTSGTSAPLIQIGSGSVETTGYVSSSTALTNAAAVATSSSTAGILINSILAANILSGHVIFTLVGSNLWIASGQLKEATTINVITSGSKTASGIIDRVRITTVSGADTFDAGSVNILIEGSL